MPTKNYADAMLDVLSRFMDEDPNFVVMGNEVLGIGPEGMQFEPFQKKYGDRILFPPCSEAAYTAMAAGAAMCGHRMFAHLGLASFTYPAISSIANEISTARTSSGGTIGVPVTLHISHGLLHGGGAQHSESPLSTYWNIFLIVDHTSRNSRNCSRRTARSWSPGLQRICCTSSAAD